MARVKIGPTDVSEDTPEWFRPTGFRTQSRPADPDIALRSGPKRAAAVVSRGNMVITDEVTPAAPSPKKSPNRTRDTLHVYDLASKNRYRDPSSVEARMKAASADPAAFRRAKSALNSQMAVVLPLRNMVPLLPSHQRLSNLRDALPRRLAKVSSAPALELQRLYTSGNLTRTLVSGAEAGRVTADTGTLLATPSDVGTTSPYARDPWMKFVDGNQVVSPTGITIPVPTLRTGGATAPAMSPIKRVKPASPDSSSLLRLPAKYKPAPASRAKLPATAPGGPRRRPHTTLDESRRALVARGLLQTRSLLRFDGYKPDATFFDSGDWEKVVDPQAAHKRQASLDASASMSFTEVGSKSVDSTWPEEPYVASPSVASVSKPHSPEALDTLNALSSFESSRGLLSPALLPKRVLRDKIKHSGDMVALGFPDDAALDAADKEALIPAYEAVVARRQRAKQAKAEAAQREAAAAAAASAKTAPVELNAGDVSPARNVPRLTPRSQRRITSRGLFK